MNATRRGTGHRDCGHAADDGVQATLQAWRTQGADRLDPVRFERIDALARRAAAQQGAVRSLLDARVAELVAAYAADLADPGAGQVHVRTPPCAAALRTAGALSALRERLVREALAREGHDGAGTPPPWSTHGRLEEARRASARARTRSQLRQALERAPENAGPLNSASLVHRALSLMRDTSPEYLQPFLAYVDSLASLEGLRVPGPPPAGPAVPSTDGSPRPRARKRAPRS